MFRNISNLLKSNFPVVAECTGSDWIALMRGFIRNHRAQALHFPQLSLEFLAYLDLLSQDVDRDEHAIVIRFPFITELAHYKWVEIDIQIARILAYGRPVHQIRPASLLLD